MDEPLTEELLRELLAAPSPQAFTERYLGDERDLAGYLQELLVEKGLKQADVVREANLNPTFGWQVFVGQRGASRNKVLQIAIAMRLDLREVNRLLKIAGHNELYCKVRRDAIIIFCVDKHYTLQETNETLYEFGEETVC